MDVQPRFHLEIGLVKLAKAGHMRDIEEVLRDLKPETGVIDSVQSVKVCGSARTEPDAVRPGRSTTATIGNKGFNRPAVRAVAEAVPSSDGCCRRARTTKAREDGTRQDHGDDGIASFASTIARPQDRRQFAEFGQRRTPREALSGSIPGDIAQVKPPKGETP